MTSEEFVMRRSTGAGFGRAGGVRRYVFIVLALLAGATVGLAQEPVLTGMGLSGSPVEVDSFVINNFDSIYVVASFTRNPGWSIRSVGLHRDSLDRVLVHAYIATFPFGTPTQSTYLSVLRTLVQVDTTVQPNVLRFRARITGMGRQDLSSFQLEFGLVAIGPGDTLVVTRRFTSHAPVGQTFSLNNPVDPRHSTYLRLDIVTLPPTITSPESLSSVGRRFQVRYRQPEDAAPGTLTLSFRRMDQPGGLPTIVFLRDSARGEAKVANLDALDLAASPDVDSIRYSYQLDHNSLQRIVLSYQDVARHPAAQDSVEPVTFDLRTEFPDLVEPQMGSVSHDGLMRVFYQLLEPADSVWLTFRADSESTIGDPFSPHVLTLHPQFYHSGLTAFFLHGADIGTNNPFVVSSNRGIIDSLRTHCVYYVTLSYRDTILNDSAWETNRGFVWPDPGVTVPPVLLAPDSGSADNQTFWIQFDLPEAPRPGSVFLTFSRVAGSEDPGSLRTLYLSRLETPGVTGFFLDGNHLSYSDMVDSVDGAGTPEQNNTLVHGAKYRVRVYYEDQQGGDLAGSSSRRTNILYDAFTELPQIVVPPANAEIPLSGLTAQFNQAEDGIAGTVQIILLQTGGPDPDPGSPHVLFVSDAANGVGKTVFINPTNLAASVGIDSIQNGIALVQRAVYQMALQYRDTLGNGYGVAYVNGLVFPSGAVVQARGRPLGSGFVIPGDNRHLSFRLSLRTQSGESALRALRFWSEGVFSPADFILSDVKLWASVDTIFSESSELLLDNADAWSGRELVFDSLSHVFGTPETHLFLTLAFAPTADVSHTIHLSLLGPSSVDCGGDPIVAERWPIGGPDVPVPVELVSIETEQDPAFGALRVIWTVASEYDNLGFNLLRRDQGQDTFRYIASWTNSRGLQGRGTDPTAKRYLYVDEGLVPGQTYFYRVESVSMNLEITSLDMIAEGIPRLPPPDFVLLDGYPNPFNQAVTIRYIVPYTAEAAIHVYDLLGRRVRTLVDELQRAAEYRVTWNGLDQEGNVLPSGIYFYRLDAGGRFTQTKKIVLLR